MGARQRGVERLPRTNRASRRYHQQQLVLPVLAAGVPGWCLTYGPSNEGMPLFGSAA